MGTTSKSVIAAAIVLGAVVAGTGGAVADRLITGADVKDGSLQYRDLSASARAKLLADAGPRSQSMHHAGQFTTQSLSLPEGRKLTTSCDGGESAGGGGTQLYLTLSSTASASRYATVNGRLDTPGSSAADPHDQIDMSFDKETFQDGEHYVAFSGTGRLEMVLESGYSTQTPGGPTSVPPDSANVSLMAHWGNTAESINVEMYVDESGCEITVQATPSRDSDG